MLGLSPKINYRMCCALIDMRKGFDWLSGLVRNYLNQDPTAGDVYLQTDGYGVYNQFGQKEKITHIGCWAHARRHFEKALDYDKGKASVVMFLIQKLYETERKAREENLSSPQRHALRLQESHSVLNEIGKYIAFQSKIELPNAVINRT